MAELGPPIAEMIQSQTYLPGGESCVSKDEFLLKGPIRIRKEGKKNIPDLDWSEIRLTRLP